MELQEDAGDEQKRHICAAWYQEGARERGGRLKASKWGENAKFLLLCLPISVVVWPNQL